MKWLLALVFASCSILTDTVTSVTPGPAPTPSPTNSPDYPPDDYTMPGTIFDFSYVTRSEEVPVRP
jgi:hypothetical protein